MNIPKVNVSIGWIVLLLIVVCTLAIVTADNASKAVTVVNDKDNLYAGSAVGWGIVTAFVSGIGLWGLLKKSST